MLSLAAKPHYFTIVRGAADPPFCVFATSALTWPFDLALFDSRLILRRLARRLL